jgi:hypothetical protein
MRHVSRIRFAAALAIAAAVGVAAPAASAQECTGLGAAKAAVCTEAVAQLKVLETAWPAAAATGEPCAAARAVIRLRGLVHGLKSAGGTLPYLAAEFDIRSEPVSAGDVEYARSLLFHAEDDEVTLSVEEGLPDNALPPGTCRATDTVLVKVEAAATAVAKAIAAYNKPALTEGAAALNKLSDTWLWVITDGFGQFPWERAFNDVVHRAPMSIYALPKVEWILLHPSVGAEFSGSSSFSETRANGSLFIEPIGFVRYRFQVDKTTRHYWGLSALVVLGSNVPPGYGALLRYDTYAIGVVNHPKTGANRGPGARSWGVTATVELFERLQAARKKLGAAEARVRGYVEAEK